MITERTPMCALFPLEVPMEIYQPQYYAGFRCLAGACPDSCCKEWAVQIDPDSAAKYRALPGQLGDVLRAALSEEDGETYLLQQDGRCPMWREDGLCRLQAQLGEEALCKTCRDFPRLRHDYGSFVELGLEMSCPEAARMIFAAAPAPFTHTTVPGGEAPEYDTELMAALLHTRREALKLLSDPAYPVQNALAILLLYGYAVQEEIDGGNPAVLRPDAMLAEARSLAQPGSVRKILDFYARLEILTDAWRQRLAAPEDAPWSDTFRPLARYCVERYWLQAVSDYDIVSRVKFTILSCLVVKSLGGNVVQTAQLYSKEIENDAENVEAILDSAYTSPALTDVALLGILLEK